MALYFIDGVRAYILYRYLWIHFHILCLLAMFFKVKQETKMATTQIIHITFTAHRHQHQELMLIVDAKT